MYSGRRRYKTYGPGVVCGVVCLILLTSCATQKQSTFVLVPDLDGHVGQLTVTNPSGTQVLDQSRQASTVRSGDAAPSPPVTLEESEINRLFGAALTVRPEGPARFLLYFTPNTADLTPDSEALMRQALQSIRDRSATAVSIVGHTDTVGARDANQTLGLERARRMADLLASQGVAPQIFEIESHGEDNPLVKTGDEVQEPRNRRVEITVW